MFTGTGDLSTPNVPVPPGGTAGRALFGRGLCTSGFPEDGSPGVLGRPHRPLDEDPRVVVERLGDVAFWWGASYGRHGHVGIAGASDDLLSGFFVYLYTWYCFPALFSLENKMQTIPLEAFYSGLGLHVDTVPAS